MDLLPPEILEWILEYIPLRDRIRCRLVCHKFNQVIPNYHLIKMDNLRKEFCKFGALQIVSDARVKNYYGSFPLGVVDSENNNIHRINIVWYSCHVENRVVVRREIYADWNSMFSVMDDNDEFTHRDGIDKVKCSIRNLLLLQTPGCKLKRFDDTKEGTEIKWIDQTIETYSDKLCSLECIKIRDRKEFMQIIF